MIRSVYERLLDIIDNLPVFETSLFICLAILTRKTTKQPVNVSDL